MTHRFKTIRCTRKFFTSLPGNNGQKTDLLKTVLMNDACSASAVIYTFFALISRRSHTGCSVKWCRNFGTYLEIINSIKRIIVAEKYRFDYSISPESIAPNASVTNFVSEFKSLNVKCRVKEWIVARYETIRREFANTMAKNRVCSKIYFTGIFEFGYW